MTAGGALDRSKSASFSIPELVQLAGEGKIRVPTFQRQFVWTAGDIRSLFDSIYRGFPVGTLLLWQHAEPGGEIRLGPFRVSAASDPNALVVVDGQQRVTSLFAALRPDLESEDERFEVYLDLAAERFVNPKRGAVSPRSIPVREALHTRSLLNWIRQHESDLETEDLDVADRLGGALQDYRVPAYVVVGDDENLLRTVFERVNSAGRPISRAQVFHALYGREGNAASAGAVVRALRARRFGDFEEGRVVQSVLAIRGGDIARDIRDEFGEREDPEEWFDRAEQALARVIDFLRAEGVPHSLLMPNTLPVPLLAAFFYLHPDPEPWNLRLLSRWLWRGWVHEFGREGGQTPVLRRAVLAVNPGNRVPTEYEAVADLLKRVPDREAPEIPLTSFNTKNANARLILLALAELNPRRADCTRVNLVGEFERHRADAVTELIKGRRSHAAARSFWPKDEIRIDQVKDEAVLRSHLLDEKTVRTLRNGDAEDFLVRRGVELSRLTARFLASKLEQGALVRPSLNELALLGAADPDD